MKISVVTVVYNAATTILDCLESVRRQDFDDHEHIIIDGRSTDGTTEILRSRAGRNVTIVSEADDGIYDAMNTGIALAKGDLVGFLNADDFFARTDSLSLLARAAEDTRAAAVCGGVAMVSPHDTRRVRRYYKSSGFDPWMLRFGHMPPHPGFYVRREALAKVGLLDHRIRTGADFEWMVRFFHVHKLTMRTLPETIVGFRLGGRSTRGFESLRDINREALASCRRWNLKSNAAAMWAKYLIKSGQLVERPSDYPLPPPTGWRPD